MGRACPVTILTLEIIAPLLCVSLDQLNLLVEPLWLLGWLALAMDPTHWFLTVPRDTTQLKTVDVSTIDYQPLVSLMSRQAEIMAGCCLPWNCSQKE